MQRTDTQPWYKQFWPWFLVLFPVVVVIMSVAKLVVAQNNQVHLVQDDYYKDGLAINQSLAEQELAEQRGIDARLSDNERQIDVLLTEQGHIYSGDQPLLLKLIHPVDSTKDLQLPLRVIPGADGQRRFVADLPRDLLQKRWYVELTSIDGENSWKLKQDFLITEPASAES